MTRKALIALTVLCVGLGAWPAWAEVPTASDFAACNMKAAEQAASDSPSALPRMDGVEKKAGKLPASVSKDPTGTTLSSDKDPQIEGMAADRANDATYIAAYRSCMRQRGF